MNDHTGTILSIIRRNVGTLTALLFQRRIVNNEIESVRRISGLVQELNHQVPIVTLRDGQWSIEPRTSSLVEVKQTGASEISADPDSFPARTLNQVLARSAIEQRNLEAISGFALIESLSGDDKTTADADETNSVNETWQNHFFRHAKYISDDEVQQLWGRVLHGEVKQPGSFSIRTLDVIAALSKQEAESFQKVAERRLQQAGTTTVSNPFMLMDSADHSNEPWPLPYLEILALKSAGLLTVGDRTSLRTDAVESDSNTKSRLFFLYGGQGILAKRPEDDVRRSLSATPFTDAGTELSRLIAPVFDPRIKQPLSQWENQFNWSITVVTVLSLDGNTVTYNDESERSLADLE